MPSRRAHICLHVVLAPALHLIPDLRDLSLALHSMLRVAIHHVVHLGLDLHHFIWIPIGLDMQVWIPIGLERQVWFGKH